MRTVPECQSTAEEVADWLETLPRTYASPVVVKIGRALFPGATYCQLRETPEGCAAYQSGERYSPMRAMYLLGTIPYARRRSSRVQFRIPGARWSWYLAGWYDRDEPSQFHPFGAMFQLMLDKNPAPMSGADAPRRLVPMYLVG